MPSYDVTYESHVCSRVRVKAKSPEEARDQVWSGEIPVDAEIETISSIIDDWRNIKVEEKEGCQHTTDLTKRLKQVLDEYRHYRDNLNYVPPKSMQHVLYAIQLHFVCEPEEE